jgi:DHA1 family bicyclomycin/chloramphenicol resistance-like MFS transporter
LQLDSFPVTVTLLFLYLSSIGLVLPNASALSMKPFDENAGSASALLGFIQMGLGSLATIVVGVFNIKTVLPLTISIMICSMFGLALAIWSTSILKHRNPQPV